MSIENPDIITYKIGDNITAIASVAAWYSVPSLIIEGSGAMYANASDFECISGGKTIMGVDFSDWAQMVGKVNCDVFTIPDSITTIANDFLYAQDYYMSIGRLVIGKNVTDIGNHAFSYIGTATLGVQRVEINSNKINHIGEWAFANNENLTHFVFTTSSEYLDVDMCAFYGCYSLGQIVYNGYIRQAGFSAFYNCRLLSSFCNRNRVGIVDSGAFTNCYHLSRVTFMNDDFSKSWSYDGFYISSIDDVLNYNPAAYITEDNLFLTQVTTRNILYLDNGIWREQKRACIKFVDNDYIVLKHVTGEIIEIMTYDSGDIALVNNNGDTRYIKLVDKDSPYRSPIVVKTKHGNKWICK